MAPVSFVGVLGYRSVTESFPDIWYLQERSDLLPRSPLRVVHVLDAASPRTETCTVVVNLMHNVESAGADQLRAVAEPTFGFVLRLDYNQVVAFLCVLRCESNGVTGMVESCRMRMTIRLCQPHPTRVGREI